MYISHISNGIMFMHLQLIELRGPGEGWSKGGRKKTKVGGSSFFRSRRYNIEGYSFFRPRRSKMEGGYSFFGASISLFIHS